MSDRPRKQFDCGSNFRRSKATGVNHRIPLTTFERFKISTAIAIKPFNILKLFRITSTPIEQCDFVSASKRSLHQVSAQKPGSSENQKLHGILLYPHFRAFPMRTEAFEFREFFH